MSELDDIMLGLQTTDLLNNLEEELRRLTPVKYSFRSPGPINRRKNIAPPIELPSFLASLSLRDEIWKNSLSKFIYHMMNLQKHMTLKNYVSSRILIPNLMKNICVTGFVKSLICFSNFLINAKLNSMMLIVSLYFLIASSKMEPYLALYNDGFHYC